jgi:hypothetical protein
MPLQTLILKLDGITAGDYLTWCRDPEPVALDFALRSISIDADPLGDTITAVLDWDQAPPPFRAAATAAGLPLSAGVQVQPSLAATPQLPAVAADANLQLASARAGTAGGGRVEAEQRLSYIAGVKGRLRTAAWRRSASACQAFE